MVLEHNNLHDALILSTTAHRLSFCIIQLTGSSGDKLISKSNAKILHSAPTAMVY